MERTCDVTDVEMLMPDWGDQTDDPFELEPVESMYRLESVLSRFPDLHVRYSEGPRADDEAGSLDVESGLELPGLSVTPLRPEGWWFRPAADWMARQLSQYRRGSERNPDRFAWVLTGRMAGRGPDCEPLLVNVVPVARLSERLLEEAERLYRERFDAGRRPE